MFVLATYFQFIYIYTAIMSSHERIQIMHALLQVKNMHERSSESFIKQWEQRQMTTGSR